MSKVFIISLPRTGTTSVCLFLLDQGFKVAHTAFSESAQHQAEVIADTPIFVDYPALAQKYPNAKYIYLERPIEKWLHSIRCLLKSMRKQWVREGHLFELDIQRCFETVFPGFLTLTEFNDAYLERCHKAHLKKIERVFSQRKLVFQRIDITQMDAGGKLLSSLNILAANSERPISLPHVNRGRRIAYWETVQHPNKTPSK